MSRNGVFHLTALAVCLSLFASTSFAQAPTSPTATATDDRSIRPFTVRVPQAALDDLRRRINATRWPDKGTVAYGTQGAQLAKFQQLVQYWGSGYDWRRIEATL